MRKVSFGVAITSSMLFLLTILSFHEPQAHASPPAEGDQIIRAFVAVANISGTIGTLTSCTLPSKNCYVVTIPPHTLTPGEANAYQALNFDPFSCFYPFTENVFSVPPSLVEPRGRIVVTYTLPITVGLEKPYATSRLLSLPPVDRVSCPGFSDVYGITGMEDYLSSYASSIYDFVYTFKASSSDAQIGRVTAPYGMSYGYFQCTRFHEGLDTSWKTENCKNRFCMAIVPTIPVVPFVTCGDWSLGIAPAKLTREMFGDGVEAWQAFKKEMEKVEEGEEPAILFGGFHLRTDIPGSPTQRAYVLMSSGEGKAPWGYYELFVPSGHIYAMCSIEAAHCHYQAALLPAKVASELIRKMRENPVSFHKIGFVPDKSSCAIRWTTIYIHSIDPAILLWPDLYDSPEQWLSHPWPQGVDVDSDAFPCTWVKTPGRGEYIAGMPYHEDTWAVVEKKDGFCEVRDKTIPGYICRILQGNNVFNSAPDSPAVYARFNHVAKRLNLLKTH